MVRSLPGLKKVALKEILVPEKLSLITNEIALHKNLNHINIVKFLKFEIKTECQKKKCYIYLEYIPGNSLFVKNYHTYLTLMYTKTKLIILNLFFSFYYFIHIYFFVIQKIFSKKPKQPNFTLPISASLTNFLSQQSYRRYESYVLFFLRQLIDGVVYLVSFISFDISHLFYITIVQTKGCF